MNKISRAELAFDIGKVASTVHALSAYVVTEMSALSNECLYPADELKEVDPAATLELLAYFRTVITRAKEDLDRISLNQGKADDQ